MKAPALFLSLFATLGLLTATAQAAPVAPKKAKASVKAKTKAATAKPVKNYDFTPDSIDGSRQMPDGTTIFGVPTTDHKSLIRLRVDFLPEITRAADRI